ncbi:phage tail protein, partial [Pontiella sp.]|uniref:phage tail protein n=1 Tax=Pontiella sp. TaxID=2837462 RepID=UPI003565B941
MPAIAAVGVVWSSIGGFTIGNLAVGAMLQQAVVSVGIGYAAKELGEAFTDDQATDYGAKVNTSSSTAAICVFYGTRVVGGNEFRAAGGEDNKYLYRVMVLGEGEMDGIDAVYFNDNDVGTYEDDDGELVYADLVRYTFHDGADGQAADIDLVQEVEAWGPDHRGFGVAYLYVRTEWDSDAFPSGMPTLTVKARGRRIYDPRAAVTAWSENPALCIRDYITNTRFGASIPVSAIDDDSFSEAANYCDELVTFTDSEGIDFDAKRYTCNGVLNPDDGCLDNVKKLLTCCRGMLVYSGGKWKLLIDKPEVALFDFNEDNIVGAWTFSGSSKNTIANQVCAYYYDTDNQSEDTLTVVSDGDYIAEDGQIFEQDVYYPLTNSLARANILAQHHLKQARQGLTASFSVTLEALAVNVGDVVTITHPVPGWYAKPFRVLSMSLESSDKIKVEVQEYDPSVYTFDVTTPPSIPDTNLPDPFSTPAPSGLVLESGTEHLQISASGTVIARLLAQWSAPASTFVDRYEVAYKLSSASGWTAFETGERQHYFSPVSDGYAYDVRVRAIYYSGRRSKWLETSGYLVVGKS